MLLATGFTGTKERCVVTQNITVLSNLHFSSVLFPLLTNSMGCFHYRQSLESCIHLIYLICPKFIPLVLEIERPYIFCASIFVPNSDVQKSKS